ncbi:LuxR family transcriptional regulator [Pseudorhodoferax sp. Leaf267]|uniref:LuxR family transcriptional regulator n=1 Tax=Pseudorhodoferax sp. Leaf267 TaxID=1736316 RepID=UPI0006F60C9E|nr:LuxR family transcriptional regulator [Pseudorhodoferax sp. Leaf267]KQP20513.1 hypothetical protein ASF43_27155 [Pseudorhodoferax sp. Leaf267]
MDPALTQISASNVHAPRTQLAIETLAAAAAELGFDGFAAVAWIPCPASKPIPCVMSNLHDDWLARYSGERDAATDPAVIWCKTHGAPLVWSEEISSHRPMLKHGHPLQGPSHGWSVAVRDALGVPGMFSLVRASRPVGADELANKQLAMQVLALRGHRMLLSDWRARWNTTAGEALTSREVEVLRWAADGKTALDTAAILEIGLSTVRFHISNAVRKLKTDNIAAAVFRALVLGLLHGLPNLPAEADGKP